MKRPERLNQLVGDALWQSHGHARRNADRLDARNVPQRLKYSHDAVRAHGQWIPAAHDYVANLGVRAQVLERRHQPQLRARTAVTAHDATARAEAAIHR